MTPQDKASELIEKFYGNKESALKAVSEILQWGNNLQFPANFWQEVNQILKEDKQWNRHQQ